MKKVFLICIPALLLAGCNQNSESKKASQKAETTISSLKKENSKLESENKDLSERVKSFESLFDTTASSESQSSNSSKSGNFKVGESATFNSNEVVTVNEIRSDDSISLHEPKEGEHPVVVTAIVENSSSEPIYFNAQTFNLYDGNSELTTFDASTYSNNIPNEIAGGKKATIVMHFSSKGNAPYSVTYGPATWNE